jgi:c-di-GMP-binding flagellar brake protein YcgR
MPERRRYERFIVGILEITGTMTFARDVKIHDISVGGVAVTVDKRLDLGGEYTLKIEGKGRALSLRGVVVWSLLSESLMDAGGNVVPVYRAGLKFVDLSQEQVSEIESFIEDHKKELGRELDLTRVGGTRLHVRFKIEHPQKAVLNFYENYKVKKIGLGGMLIESKYELDIDDTFPMEIKLTDEKSMKFIGRIASCLPKEQRKEMKYDIGVEFLDVSERNKSILHEFIRLLNDIDKSGSL